MPLLGSFDITSKGWSLFTKSISPIWKAAWKSYLLVGAAALLVGISEWIDIAQQGTPLAVFSILAILAAIVLAIWGGVAFGIRAIEILVKQYNGTDLNLGNPYKFILPLIGVSLLSALVIFGGYILLIIPGILFTVWFQFSMYSLLIDNQRGTKALKHSRSLVMGRFWKVFGRLIIVGIVVGIFSFILSIPSSILTAISDSLMTTNEGIYTTANGLLAILSILISVVTTYFSGIFGAATKLVMYQNLKETPAKSTEVSA